MATVHTNAHLSRTYDVVHKMFEISTYENHRSGVKDYWGMHMSFYCAYGKVDKQVWYVIENR
jgi:hypothetical protein